MRSEMKQLLRITVASLPLLALSVAPAHAQYNGQHGQFYNGARNSGHGDYSGHDHRYDNQYRNNQYRDNRDRGHGIGTGRGALIGGAGGATLGAVFGGGLKGSLVGGAAGAGVGAFAGHEHQKTVRRHDEERGYRR